RKKVSGSQFTLDRVWERRRTIGPPSLFYGRLRTTNSRSRLENRVWVTPRQRKSRFFTRKSRAFGITPFVCSANLAGGGAGFRGGKFGEEKFENGATLGVATALKKIVGALERLEAGDKARLGDFSGAFDREHSFVRRHGKSLCGLPWLRDTANFAGFDEFAVHPSESTKDLYRLFALAQKAIEKIESSF